MAQTVLETVLGELGLTPAEYFQRLSQSLDDIRQARLHRVSSSRDTDLLIQEEVAPTDFGSLLLGDTQEGFGISELTEEDTLNPLAPATAASPAARAARPKRVVKARAARLPEEEEDELTEFGLEPLDDGESQFRQAYRRALRTNRRPFRER